MKRVVNRLILSLALTLASIVAVFRGNEAKQKLVFRIKSRIDERKQEAEQKKIKKQGGIMLDEIEIAAYHNS
jgi:hypothetical protein